MNGKQTSVLLTKEQAVALEETALKYNVTVSSLIRAALEMSTSNYTDMIPIMLAARPLISGRPIGWRGTYKRKKKR
jgi:hypothetical protein